jgi:hypothetical protein
MRLRRVGHYSTVTSDEWHNYNNLKNRGWLEPKSTNYHAILNLLRCTAIIDIRRGSECSDYKVPSGISEVFCVLWVLPKNIILTHYCRCLNNNDLRVPIVYYYGYRTKSAKVAFGNLNNETFADNLFDWILLTEIYFVHLMDHLESRLLAITFASYRGPIIIHIDLRQVRVRRKPTINDLI